METSPQSETKIVRIVSALYLVLVAIASYGMGYVPTRIFVPRDASATMQNVLKNEFLFRSGILSHLTSTTMIIVLVLMLYRLFNHVCKQWSRFMIAPVLLQGAIVVILECFNMAALSISKGEAMMVSDRADQEQAVYFLLRMHGLGIGVSQLFWGLWLLPFAMLVYRSGYAPRVFAVLLIINGAGYIIETCAYILLQRSDFLTVRIFTRLTFVGLPLTMLWFLFRGIRRQPQENNNNIRSYRGISNG